MAIRDKNKKLTIAKEIIRVLKTGGIFFWYDIKYSNIFNSHTTFETKNKIKDYFPEVEMQLKAMTLLPQIGRKTYNSFLEIQRKTISSLLVLIKNLENQTIYFL